MKLFHFHNTVNGEFNESKFQEGNKWFFDRNTVISFWLPAQKEERDQFIVLVLEVKAEWVYETGQHIDNSSVIGHIEDAVADCKWIIGGLWDSKGSKQYFVIPYRKVKTSQFNVSTHQIRDVVEDLSKAKFYEVKQTQIVDENTFKDIR